MCRRAVTTLDTADLEDLDFDADGAASTENESSDSAASSYEPSDDEELSSNDGGEVSADDVEVMTSFGSKAKAEDSIASSHQDHPAREATTMRRSARLALANRESSTTKRGVASTTMDAAPKAGWQYQGINNAEYSEEAAAEKSMASRE